MEKRAGTWAQAARGEAKPLDLEWIGPDLACFDPLPGWKAPLWRVRDGALEILRPQGLWRARLEGRAQPFVAMPRAALGWSSRRGLEVDPRLDGAWRSQLGERVDPSALDAAMLAPLGMEALVDGSGELAKWELGEDGSAIAWLDDAFERGPLSCARERAFLLVSNGERKIAYYVGSSHWAWPMFERGQLVLRLGRGGGWEPERDVKPIFL